MAILDTLLMGFIVIATAIATGFLGLFLWGVGVAIMDIPQELKKIRIALERSEENVGESEKEKA